MAAPFLADLHVHSPYAFACSRALTLENLSAWAQRKGIDLLATGDFTHPIWAKELQRRLRRQDDGLYEYGGVRFVPGTEISCVYRQDGRGRRVHLLALLPTLESAAEFTGALAQHGKLENDGRPTVSLSAANLARLAFDADPDAIIIPAHAWTPWYGIYGSRSGFDTLEEAFQDLTPAITAIETGLSSDPAMNWSVPDLGSRAVVSFSDAHSLPRLGREMTAFQGSMTWTGLRRALQESGVAYTVEFYPEEGKYHHSGHRKCGVSFDSAQLAANGPDCPVCGRALTLGVLHRVSSLARALAPDAPRPDASGFIHGAGPQAPYARLIPLQEIIAAVRNRGVNTRTVRREYTAVTDALGSELTALLFATASDLGAAAREDVAAAILEARAGRVHITPGFDGQYGTIRMSIQEN
jgi:uncharacterized protein (TIGR00375 family)